MAMITYSMEGRIVCLDGATARSQPDHWTLRLFKNDVDPDDTFQADDFTEADFDGYAPQIVGPWDDAQDDGSGAAAAITTNVLHFEKVMGPHFQYAYGWYVTDLAGDVLFSERFPDKATFDAAGDKVDIQLSLSFGACAAAATP